MHYKSHDRVSVVISNVKILGSKTKLALFSAEFPSGTVFHQLLLERTHTKDDYTIIPPRIPLVNQHGELIRDGSGRIVTEPAISFTNATSRSTFQNSLFRALAQQCPNVFLGSLSRTKTEEIMQAAQANASAGRFVTAPHILSGS